MTNKDINKIIDNNKSMVEMKMNVDLKKYSTWKVGGELKNLLTIKNVDELKTAIQTFKVEKTPFFIMGKGSNTLFPDGMTDAVGIKLDGEFSDVDIDGDVVRVGAGASMVFLAIKTAKAKLTGLEFASGIPGSVGGSLVMNAGANGNEISDTLMEVVVLEKDGEIKTLKRDEINFEYRKSDFMTNKKIILSAKFKLKPEELTQGESAKQKIKRLKENRLSTQPYHSRCAGSVFKNPPGTYSAKIIEELGLKGMSVGGASVSEKHANFIINNGNATEEDIKTLIDKIQKIVFEKKQIHLHREVRFFGQEDIMKWD